MRAEWTTKDIGDLHGLTAIVTGANSGIGFHTALELGRKGAHVVVACRDPSRGQDALTALREEAPAGSFTLEALDLADLSSVRAFVARLPADFVLDLLVNNAGVMAVPTRERTVDGFERQMGTNHLGHFALTGLLLPFLRKSKAPRVVSVSSSAAYLGKVTVDDLQSERRYSPMMTYSATKLANLLFMRALARKVPWLQSIAAHPGITISNLQRYEAKGITSVIGQHASMGALPSLYAAVGPAENATFIAPKDWFGIRGLPTRGRLPKRALDDVTADALWQASEALTGVRYPERSDAKRAA
jgi:NAD(P)-dependent dehydrogenase (short-subunit alcohol dehydrogenase family)